MATKKKAKKKATRKKNPCHGKKKVARKKNPRRSLKKDHLWKVFRVMANGKIDFYGGVGQWNQPNNRAVLFRTKSAAEYVASGHNISGRGAGIANADATVAQIRKALGLKA